MWYEILPSFGIIVVCMGVPHFSAYLFNKVLIGNFYRRKLANKDQQMHYIRDRRITNDPYKLSGLESIPNK